MQDQKWRNGTKGILFKSEFIFKMKDVRNVTYQLWEVILKYE